MKINISQTLKIFVAIVHATTLINCSTNTQLVKMTERIESSEQYKNGKFQNKKKIENEYNLFDIPKFIYKIYLEEHVDTEPNNVLPLQNISINNFYTGNKNEIRFSRLGHSTIILQLEGKVWLIDPVFSERASPFKWFGAKRFHPVPINLDQLPKIEGVIISHDHYDHLDYSTIMKLKEQANHFLVPLGVDKRILDWGVSAKKISSFDWWDSMKVGDVEFISAPAQHFSGRNPFHGDETLWCSWIIRTKKHSIYYSGDSGYFDGFKEIGEKYGPFLVTFLECGQYSEDWIDFHMLPEHTVLAYKDLKGKLLVPVHNGTFSLSIHTWYDPLDRIFKLGQKKNIPVLIPLMGQIINGLNPPKTSMWWHTNDDTTQKNIEKKFIKKSEVVMKFNKNKVNTVPALTPVRLFRCMWRQKSNTAVCPDEPRLDGKLAIVTGGNNGIGLETSKGLAKRGADVIILARNKEKSDKAIQEIKETTGKESHFVSLDLSDLKSVFAAVDKINKQWPNRTIDLFIANAGIIPTNYSQSAQEFEKTFSVNTLGHYAMIRKLYDSSKLTAGARILMLAGDIYILSKDCTPDFKYESPKGNQTAYCRSKLGVMWIVHEFSKRYKDVEIYAVHPGVVASGLMGEASGFGDRVKHAIFLKPEQGAQTSIICATQKDLTSGEYYHNTLGKTLLRKNDPAKDEKKAADFFDLLEDIATNFIK